MTKRAAAQPDENAAEFARRLEAYVRRRRYVSFARVLPVAVALALVVVALLGTLSGGIEAAWPAGLTALVCGALAAAAFSAGTTRVRLATAAAVDRRLAIRDHIVTAYQFLDEADPVSRAVVAGAVGHLRADPAVAFPLERPAFPAATLLALAAGVALVGAPPRLMTRAGAEAAGASTSESADASAGASRAAASSSNAVATTGARTPSTTKGREREHNERTAAVVQTSQSVPARGSEARDGLERTVRPQQAGDTRDGAQPAVASDGRSATRSGAAHDGAARFDSGNGGDGGGGSAESSLVRSAASGGVTHGVLDSRREVAAERAAEGPGANRTPYAAAQQNAEEAIARGRVPRRLQPLVRAYFAGLAAGKER